MLTPKKKRRETVLSIARELLFKDSATAWKNALSFERLELASGIDRRQIVRDFGKKENLMRELVGYCLSRVTAKFEVEVVEEVSKAPEPANAYEKTVMLATLADTSGQQGDDFSAQVLFWALLRDDPEVAKQLKEAYRTFDEVCLDGCRDIDANPQWGLERVGDITDRDFAVLTSAVVEGLAMRAAVDPEAVPAGLTAKACMAMLESMWKVPGSPPLGSKLQGLSYNEG